eukprot:5981290-Pyramimonas_sp.AAC.1
MDQSDAGEAWENNITSFYGPSCANNGKGALNTPETPPALRTNKYGSADSSLFPPCTYLYLYAAAVLLCFSSFGARLSSAATKLYMVISMSQNSPVVERLNKGLLTSVSSPSGFSGCVLTMDLSYAGSAGIFSPVSSRQRRPPAAESR